jgi:RNA polymerase sigma factor (sigma-70 family)
MNRSSSSASATSSSTSILADDDLELDALARRGAVEIEHQQQHQQQQHHLLPKYLRQTSSVTTTTTTTWSADSSSSTFVAQGDSSGSSATTGSSNRAAERRQQQERDSLYTEFHPLVQRLIRKYGDNPELRKDLEGEIYCLFCHLLEAYDAARGVPLKPYLVHQLTASVYTLARRRWRQERREVSLEVREDVSIGVNHPAQDPSDQWDHQIAMEQVREMLPQAIAKLPQRQRQVVIWRYYEHRSFEDIAEALGVRVATTRSLLRHGLNGLRRAFAAANLPFDISE